MLEQIFLKVVDMNTAASLVIVLVFLVRLLLKKFPTYTAAEPEQSVTVSQSTVSVQEKGTEITLLDFAKYLWLAGVCVLLLYCAVSLLRIHRSL